MQKTNYHPPISDLISPDMVPEKLGFNLLRNEEGYSYNFFENYPNGGGDNIEVNINGNGFVPQVYENNHWPILAITPMGTTNNTETDIEIKLRTDDNPEPLIYHTDVVTTPDKKYGLFIGTNAILNMSAGITALWTNPLLFKAFNCQNGSVFQNVATYNRINYFRQTAYEGNNPKVPERTNLYKNFFGPINHSEINNNNGIRRLNLGTHNLDSGTLKENDYIQVVDRYVTWDDDIIVFQTGTTDSYQKSKAYVNTQKVGYKNKIAIQIQANSTNKDYLLNFYFDKFTIDDNGNEIPVLELTSNEGTQLEEHAILGLSKTEFNTIANIQTLSTLGFDVHSDIFISLKFDTALPFGDNKTCDRFKIELTGNDLNGHYKTELLTQTVYTLDWVTFTTKDFIETSIKQEVFDYRGIFYVDDDGDVVKLDYNLTQKVDDDFRRAYDEMMTTMIGSEIWKEYIESREHTILIRLVDIEQGLGYVLENPKSLKKGGFTLFNTSAHINSNNYIHAKLLKPNSNSGNLIYFDNISMSIFLNDSSKIPFSNFHFIAYDKSHLKKVSKKLAAEIIYHEITAHVHIDSGDLFDMEVIRGWKDPHHIIFGLDCDMVFIDTDGVEQRLPTDAGGYSINRDLIQGKIRADEFISDIMKNHLDYFVSYKGYTFEGITEEMNKLKQRLAGKDILSFVTEINE